MARPFPAVAKAGLLPAGRTLPRAAARQRPASTAREGGRAPERFPSEFTFSAVSVKPRKPSGKHPTGAAATAARERPGGPERRRAEARPGTGSPADGPWPGGESGGTALPARFSPKRAAPCLSLRAQAAAGQAQWDLGGDHSGTGIAPEAARPCPQPPLPAPGTIRDRFTGSWRAPAVPRSVPRVPQPLFQAARRRRPGRSPRRGRWACAGVRGGAPTLLRPVPTSGGGAFPFGLNIPRRKVAGLAAPM